jgi:DNA helicase-2/ATP-dependent DNA helicase PcrA
MARGVEFYNRKEIKDTLAYLRVIANPTDEVSLERIVNVPTRGIGDSSVKQMKTFAIASGISLWNAMERASEVTGLSSRALNSTRAFVDLVTSWRTLAAQQKSEDLEPDKKGPVQTLMEDVVRRSGLEAYYRKEGGDEQEERSNIDQLITSAAEFDHENATATLDEYLSMISLVSDVDHLKGKSGAITMMTLHAAKGLEFPVVAMIGLEDGCLPHARAREDGAQLEEERRLAFVGITRAQERLILTKSAYRTIRGLRERTVPSKFLTELPADAMEIEDRSGQSPSSWRNELPSQTDFDAPPTAQFRQGQMVRHPTFGIGRIAEVTDAGQHTRAVVQFNQAGRKTLILQYARLEAVG